MAAIARVPHVTSHSLQHQPKNINCRDAWYISWYKYNLQVNAAMDPNPILYFYYAENVAIKVIWNAICEFVTEKPMLLWWNPAAHAQSHFCFLSSRDVVGWFQHRIHCVLLYAMCDLTVLLHDCQNLMLLVVICCWCEVNVCRDPGTYVRLLLLNILLKFESCRRQSVGLWSCKSRVVAIGRTT